MNPEEITQEDLIKAVIGEEATTQGLGGRNSKERKYWKKPDGWIGVVVMARL